jgi:hypothetical protein
VRRHALPAAVRRRAVSTWSARTIGAMLNAAAHITTSSVTAASNRASTVQPTVTAASDVATSDTSHRVRNGAIASASTLAPVASSKPSIKS